MRFKEYKKAKMKDPRTKQIPQRTVPINCHKGRTVNPRDRTIFPKLQTPKNGPRQTYDLIEPSKLVFDEPWHWDEEKQRVVNHETGFGYKWYNRKSFRDNLIGVYMLFFWIIANYDNLEKTRIVFEEYDVD